jgi:DNA-directed RNA polymerase specialized sigma24 family protein
MDTAETGKALGLSVENVKTRLHRARRALKTLIEQQCNELVK